MAINIKPISIMPILENSKVPVNIEIIASRKFFPKESLRYFLIPHIKNTIPPIILIIKRIISRITS